MLQRIYEDHVGDADIFVTPLRIHQSTFLGVDHIDGAVGTGPALSDSHGVFTDVAGGIRSPTVELLEHGLIAYFVPPYNEKPRHRESSRVTRTGWDVMGRDGTPTCT
jgi:hypothetical protein